DSREVEPLAARQDGDGDLVHLGGGEDELDVRRRLLKGLQQGVEGLLGEHVDFVDDVDLVARPGGAVLNVGPDVAHLVDPAVAGGQDGVAVGRRGIGGGGGRGRVGRLLGGRGLVLGHGPWLGTAVEIVATGGPPVVLRGKSVKPQNAATTGGPPVATTGNET